MAKTYNLRRIRNKRSYSFKELADLLGVHVRTVQAWYKDGLPIIEGSQYPYLVLGSGAKSYLKDLQSKRKSKLQSGECYCVACHKAVTPIDVKTQSNKRKMGEGKESISLIGKCPLCQNKVFRFGSRELSKTSIKKSTKSAKKVVEKTAKESIEKEVPTLDDAFKDLPLFGQCP
jgi:hypothetical protein